MRGEGTGNWDSKAQRHGAHSQAQERVVSPNVVVLVFEFVKCDRAETTVLVGGATPPFRRAVYPARAYNVISLGPIINYCAIILTLQSRKRVVRD